jgi:hypothetical protein
MNRHHYHAFGLSIGAAFPIGGLLPGQPPFDVTISKGKTPRTLPDLIIHTEEVQSSRDAVLFIIEGVGRFYIANGHTIIVEPNENAAQNELVAYLMGAAFGALLFQRGLLPLHGSTLNIDGNAVILVGKSGSGKSTLTRALLNRGGQLMCDDLSPVETPLGKPAVVFPGYPLQKLSYEMIDAMGINPESGPLDAVMDSVPKYQVPCQDRFFASPLKVGFIYELAVWDGDAVQITPFKGAQKTSVIMTHTYGKYLANGLDVTQAFFDQCIELVRTVNVCRLQRPRDRFSADEMADLLISRS